MQVDSQLEDLLHAEIGDHLRSIVSYEEQNLQFHFLRHDIEDEYERSDFYEIFDDLILEGMARGYLESRFNAGKLQTAVYGFEEAIIFHFTADELSGVVVSVDRDTHPDFESFVSKIEAAIST